MEFGVLQMVLIATGLLNFCISIYIGRRDDLERFQKIAQIFLVWLIPVIGALGLWSFHHNNDNPKPTKKGSFGGGPIDSAGVSQSGD